MTGPTRSVLAAPIAAPRPLDEADLSYLLARESLESAKVPDIVRRHPGFLGTRFLDRMARVAGRPEYDE